MTDYGDSSYPVIISDAESSGPSGNKIYILAKGFRSSTTSLQRKRPLRSGLSSKFATGKKNISINITQGLILASELNNIKSLLETSIDTSSKVYVWNKLTSSTYEQFKNASTGSYVNYLLAYVNDFTISDYSATFKRIDITLEDAWE
jgi:hypothetical protein